MTKTGKVNKLKQHIEKPFLEIHPRDAEERGIQEGDPVVIANGRGEVRVNAKVTTDIKRGVVFLPMHWGKILNRNFGRANNLTQNLVDPVSKEPDFKFSTVQVIKYVKPRQKIVVVGAAACRFVSAYREKTRPMKSTCSAANFSPFITGLCSPTTSVAAAPGKN